MRPGLRFAFAALLLAVQIGAAHAAAGTDCSFGGPTPGWQVVKLDLPQGSSFLTLELGSIRTQRGLNDNNNWHLASGILVVNAATLKIEAFRVSSKGMAPRRVVVADGTSTTSQDVTVADVPYEHSRSGFRDGLPAGSYYVISFGSDGGSKLANEWWSAGVQVSPHVACTGIGDGVTFDYDQTEFDGMQVYAPGVGYAEDVELSVHDGHELVAGLMDVETQGRAASNVALHYDMPGGSGDLSQQLVPFLSVGGDFHFAGSYQGEYPLLAIAGVGVDLP